MTKKKVVAAPMPDMPEKKLDLSFYERDKEELENGKWFQLQFGNIEVKLKEYRQNALISKMIELSPKDTLENDGENEQTIVGKKAFAECFVLAIRQGDVEVTDRNQINALMVEDKYELLADEIFSLVNQKTNFMLKKDT